MIDTTIFHDLRRAIEDKDEKRETLIVQSRPVIKESKKAIYALHRNDIETAKNHIDAAKKQLQDLNNIAQTHPESVTGIYHAAQEEFAEAMTYFGYVTEKKLVSPEDVGVDAENYLLGLSDLTGEMGRRAVHAVTREEFEEVKNIKEFIETIHHEMMEFALRNSELRKKSDSIKWNLKKVEEILYELKLREKI